MPRRIAGLHPLRFKFISKTVIFLREQGTVQWNLCQKGNPSAGLAVDVLYRLGRLYMKSKLLLAASISGILVLSGCANPPTQEDTGMVIGGILGGVLGSHVGEGHGRTAAIIAGTMIGSRIGGSIGKSMDETDRLRTAQTLETVRTGVPSHWRNPDTGNQYTVTPTRTYETAANSGPCREYTIDAVIGGKNEKVYGTACRQPDGSWQTQN
jgi:surface antigen